MTHGLVLMPRHADAGGGRLPAHPLDSEAPDHRSLASSDVAFVTASPADFLLSRDMLRGVAARAEGAVRPGR